MVHHVWQWLIVMQVAWTWCQIGKHQYHGLHHKTAVIETRSMIWEYDPSDPNNCVLGGGLDIIPTIHTLAIKVCISVDLSCHTNSSECIDTAFRATNPEIQISPDQVYNKTSLKLTVHGNTHWGSAFGMLDCACWSMYQAYCLSHTQSRS